MKAVLVLTACQVLEIGDVNRYDIFIAFLCLLSYAIAEPPVGDGYASPLSHNHDHHDHDHHDHVHHDHAVDIQRSHSDEAGVPRSFGARNLPTQYGPPRSRASNPSQSYGPPRASQEYAPHSNLGQQYGPPSGRLSQNYGVPNRNNLGQDYEMTYLRSASNDYLPAAKSSDHPLTRSRGNAFASGSPSTLYGAPESRSQPSGEYGSPSHSSGRHGSLESQYSALAPLQQYGVPSARGNNGINGHSAPRNFQSSARISQNYGTPPASSYSSQPRTSYGVPAARNTDSFSQGYNGPSESYGVPNGRDLSDTYGVPETRGLSQQYGAPEFRELSQEYGAPSSRTSFNTDALVSSYANTRSSPSSTYGAPSARDAMPSDQYRLSDQYSNENQGYEYARSALEELLNQEPANYDFAYKVNDYLSGSDFGHTESRQENKAEGTYFVVLPDGTKQTVEYEADERGFKPRILVEPVDLTRSGYDENAADLARSGDGPY